MRQARERVWAERTANSTYAPELDEADAQQNDNQSEVLLRLADQAELFRTAAGVLYVRVPVKQHRQTWPLRGSHFTNWLSYEYLRTTSKAPSATAVTNTVKSLAGNAQYEGEEREVHIRHAWHA